MKKYPIVIGTAVLLLAVGLISNMVSGSDWIDCPRCGGDGIAEVCAGTNLVHILQWNGFTYIEEAVLPTFGGLAVVQDFMSWVFKYGWESNRSEDHS